MLTIEIKDLGPYYGGPKAESFDPTHILENFISDFRDGSFDLDRLNRDKFCFKIVVSNDKVPSGHSIQLKTTSILRRDKSILTPICQLGGE